MLPPVIPISHNLMASLHQDIATPAPCATPDLASPPHRYGISYVNHMGFAFFIPRMVSEL